jgi:hypothetical protein
MFHSSPISAFRFSLRSTSVSKERQPLNHSTFQHFKPSCSAFPQLSAQLRMVDHQPSTLSPLNPYPPPFTRPPKRLRALSPYRPSLTKSPSRKPLRATIYEKYRGRGVGGHEFTSKMFVDLSAVPSITYFTDFHFVPPKSFRIRTYVMEGGGGVSRSMEHLQDSSPLSFSALRGWRSPLLPACIAIAAGQRKSRRSALDLKRR